MHSVSTRLRAALLAAVLLPLLFLVAGCGSSGGGSKTTSSAPPPAAGSSASPPAATGAATITIDNFTFAPKTLSVAPGATVTVINKDTVDHTVTANDKSFDTGTVAPGATKSFTAPAKAGTYGYLCTIHPFMTADLTVG